jgi:hypothetical protein
VHHESFFRRREDETLSRWHGESAARLVIKWRTADLSPFTPELV